MQHGIQADPIAHGVFAIFDEVIQEMSLLITMERIYDFISQPDKAVYVEDMRAYIGDKSLVAI